MKKAILITSIILNITLMITLGLILNTEYQTECENFTSKQKIIDYIIGRD